MSETLLPCPFCGGEAMTLTDSHVIAVKTSVGCQDDECRGFIGLSWLYDTEAEAIAAWNTRSDYYGYEQAAIEAWESVKEWNTRNAGTCHSIDPVDSGEFFICSNCNFGAGRVEFIPNYCPSCGCKVVKNDDNR